MPKKVLVILNPSAGKDDPDSVREALESSLESASEWSGEVRETQGAGDAKEWAGAAEAEGFDRIVAVGGDGTVAEAAEGLLRAGSNLPLAIVPGGTANVLAGVLRLPNDPSEALALGLSGEVRSFDVGYLPQLDRFFLIGLGVGIPGQAVEKADRKAKDRFGFAAYVGAFVEGLIENRTAVLTIEVDGKSTVAPGQSAVIANLGEKDFLGVTMAEGISPHDGALDLFVIDHTEPGAVLAGLKRLFGDGKDDGNGKDDGSGKGDGNGKRGTKKEVPGFLHQRGRSIEIAANPSLSVQVDGEWIGRTPVQVTLASRRVNLVVGEDYAPKEVSGETGGD